MRDKIEMEKAEIHFRLGKSVKTWKREKIMMK